MAREGKAYLTELVESVICVPDAFRIRCGNDNFIFPFSPKIRKPMIILLSQLFMIRFAPLTVQLNLLLRKPSLLIFLSL